MLYNEIVGGVSLYSIKEVANISGVTIRTLQYYDKINLLNPSKGRKENNYRVYTDDDLNKLQLILFYKELDFPLEEIKKIISINNFNLIESLENQIKLLEEKQKRVERIHILAKTTLNNLLGEKNMKPDEKFEAFKDEVIKENDDKYGKEVISKYGEDTYKESMKKYKNLSKEQHKELEELSNNVNEAFIKAKKTNDPNSKEAKEAVVLHRKWIMYFWPTYDKDAYLVIANTYVDDERFAAYYNKLEEGMAVFVRDSIVNFINNEQ